MTMRGHCVRCPRKRSGPQGQGEALSEAGSDEACARVLSGGHRPGLLGAVLARENMQQHGSGAANKGAGGIDGLGIDETRSV